MKDGKGGQERVEIRKCGRKGPGGGWRTGKKRTFRGRVVDTREPFKGDS